MTRASRFAHRIAVRDNQLHFLGTTVNSMADSDGAFARLAQAVAAAVPGLEVLDDAGASG